MGTPSAASSLPCTSTPRARPRGICHATARDRGRPGHAHGYFHVPFVIAKGAPHGVFRGVREISALQSSRSQDYFPQFAGGDVKRLLQCCAISLVLVALATELYADQKVKRSEDTRLNSSHIP